MGSFRGGSYLFVAYLADWIQENFFLNQQLGVFLRIVIQNSPGVIFAVAITLFVILLWKTKYSWVYIPLWIIFSGIAYYCAVETTARTFLSYHSGAPSGLTNASIAWQLLSFFVGGTVGAFIMLTAFHFFLSRFNNFMEYISLVFLGGILGFGWFLTPYEFSWYKFSWLDAERTYMYLSLFIIWQTGMAFALGWVLDKKENHSQPQT